ncbi:hypothetical protein [Microbacterium sp. NPDC058389]|uniref:hypothetical protein n=1 Tax=Microbacterium sp. NPDC058389 TaxID=3346475 RepID=UPI0036465083
MPDLESTVRAEIDRRSPELTKAKRLDAVVDASRQALLAVVPRLQPGLAAATARQAELPPRPADTSRGHVTLVVFALLFGAFAPAMVLPSPRNGRPVIDVDQGALWVGIWAVASLVCFALLSRRQLTSKYLNPRVKGSRIFIVFAVIWIVTLVYILFNWDEVDMWEPFLPILGTVMLVLSIVGMIVLWVRAKGVEKRYWAEVAAAGGVDPAAEGDPVAEWWAGVAAQLTPAERGAGDTSYGVTLRALEERGIIRAQDAARLRRKNPPVVWAGDAS